MRKTVIALVLVAAAALPANATAARLHGIVVSKQPAAHVLVVAARNGTAWTVRTGSTAAVGSIVTASAKPRPDGTFAASQLRTLGRASHARVRGVVIKSVAGTTFLSAGRSIIAVRSKKRTLMSRAQTGPAPGTVATVGLSIGQSGSLTATSMTPTGKSDRIVIEATVSSLTPATATTPGSLTLAVGGQPLVIPLPAGTTLSSTVVAGAMVTLTIKLQPTGPVGGTKPGDTAKDDDDDEDEEEDEHEDDEEDDDEDDDDEDDDDKEDDDD
jgi:hypothetical protein